MKYFLVVLVAFLLSGGVANASEEELLKEYFFYSCVNDGHAELEISMYDGSAGYSAELLSSSFSTIKTISNFAKKTAVEIPRSAHGNKKNVLGVCLNAYNSEELKSVISEVLEAK